MLRRTVIPETPMFRPEFPPQGIICTLNMSAFCCLNYSLVHLYLKDLNIMCSCFLLNNIYQRFGLSGVNHKVAHLIWSLLQFRKKSINGLFGNLDFI